MRTSGPSYFRSCSGRFFFAVLLVALFLVGGTCGRSGAEIFVSSGCVQGSGNLKSEARTLPNFHALDIDGAFSVKIDCQKKQSLSLSADDNLLPQILTDVNNGILKITTRKAICTSLPMTVTITVDSLDRIRSGGANGFTVNDVSGNNLELALSGSGNMEVTGKTKTLSINLEGASEIHAINLKATDVNISIAGAGSAEVYAESNLNASISGVGEIRYAGEPKNVVRNITGWGEVSPVAR